MRISSLFPYARFASIVLSIAVLALVMCAPLRRGASVAYRSAVAVLLIAWWLVSSLAIVALIQRL